MNHILKNLVTTFVIVVIIFICHAIARQKPEEHHEKAENLKVLPKNMPDEEIHELMKIYSKSLGVRCNHCHAQSKADPKKLSFASDEKPEKEIARKMMKMTADINKKYITKIGNLESVTCVTCHMGHLKPTVSVDSLSIAH
jgi:hypothetical protein